MVEIGQTKFRFQYKPFAVCYSIFPKEVEVVGRKQNAGKFVEWSKSGEFLIGLESLGIK